MLTAEQQRKILRADDTPRLSAALVEAVKARPGVEKKEKSTLNYPFLAEEDITAALHKVLPLHGLVIVPRRMKVVHKEVYASTKGGRMVNVIIRARYRLLHSS